MIHKPTNPFPYNTVINLSDYNPLTFSLSSYGSNKITDARFQINDGNTSYYFNQGNNTYEIEWEVDASNIDDTSEGFITPTYPLWGEPTYGLYDSTQDNYITFKASNAGGNSPRYYRCKYISNGEKGEQLLLSGVRYYGGVRQDEIIDSPQRILGRLKESEFPTTKWGEPKIFVLPQSKTDRYNVIKYSLKQTNSEPSVTYFDDNINFSMLPNKGYQGITDVAQTTLTSYTVYGSNNAILQPNKEYSWQCRLYEDANEYSPNNCLGYGFVDSFSLEGTSLTSDIIKTRPHTLVEYNVASGYSGANAKNQYFIKIKGNTYRVKEFWNSDISHEITDYYGKTQTVEAETDSYGNALYGYAILENPDSSFGSGGRNIVGERYTLCCNYIDSDEYYFSTTQTPSLRLYKGSNDSAEEIVTESIEIDYSNLQLYGQYIHPTGITLNRYRVRLYKTSQGEEALIDDTGYVQDSNISYSYNRIQNCFAGEFYRLEINATDANNYSIHKNITIIADYPIPIFANISTGVVKPAITPYSRHSSIMIDISELVPYFKGLENSQKTFLGFNIYKTMGNKDTLFLVQERITTGIVEDFLVGDGVEYRYYLDPIFEITTDESSEKLQIQGTIISDPVILNQGRMKLIGLKSIPNRDNYYTIDVNNVWDFGLELSDSGATVNNAKAFTDTQNRYSKETVGSTHYVTKQVSGLLGKVDCSSPTHDYLDTYDNIIDWREFVGGSQLKAFIDLRGVIYICDTEASPSDTYDAQLNYATKVTFTIHEIDNLNNISILARELTFNPTEDYAFLMDCDSNMLTDCDDVFLLSSGQEV